jgi:uncharacterized protein YjbJ (UPF0337 family)
MVANKQTTASKAKTSARRVQGKAKETTGRVTGNPRLESEGLRDQTVADLKDAAAKAAGLLRGAGEKVGDLLNEGGERLKNVSRR